jgi:hypothetical protein
MSMYEASAEPWDPAVPDEYAGYDMKLCPNCNYQPFEEGPDGCDLCGYVEEPVEPVA